MGPSVNRQGPQSMRCSGPEKLLDHGCDAHSSLRPGYKMGPALNTFFWLVFSEQRGVAGALPSDQGRHLRSIPGIDPPPVPSRVIIFSGCIIELALVPPPCSSLPVYLWAREASSFCEWGLHPVYPHYSYVVIQ